MEMSLGLILHLLTHQETTSRCLLGEGAVWGAHRCSPCSKSAPQASTELSCTGSAVGESSLAPADPMARFPHNPVIPHGTGGHCLHPPRPPGARFGDSGREAEPAPSDHSGTQLKSWKSQGCTGLWFQFSVPGIPQIPAEAAVGAERLWSHPCPITLAELPAILSEALGSC